MESLERVKELSVAGRFREAFAVLEKGVLAYGSPHAVEIIKADLLEQLGRYGQARMLASRLLRSKTLSPSERGTCEFVLARIDREDGDLQSSLGRLQQSINLALQGQQTDQACWP